VKAAILEIDGMTVGFSSPADVAGISEKNLLAMIEAGWVIIVCYFLNHHDSAPCGKTRRELLAEVELALADRGQTPAAA
jgi:hypothetical protein